MVKQCFFNRSLIMRYSLIWAILQLPTVLLAQTQGDDVVWAEVSVSDTTPFVQQALVYTVVVKSAEQLTKVPEKLDLPAIRGVAPSKQIYSNLSNPYQLEYRFALTPLTIGQIKIPPTQIDVIYSVDVTPPPQWGRPPPPKQFRKYSAEIQTEELILNVQPPATSQRLWLPLKGLELQGQVDKTSVANVGDPITVVLTLDAIGMSGEQLPTLVLPVDEKNFHVYAERPQTSQAISPDKTTLIGQRIEKYTLVPQRQGKLEIPVVRLYWWDIEKNRESMVEWLGPVVQVGDVMPAVSTPTLDEKEESINKMTTDNLLLKIGIIGFILFLIGWWLGAGRPGKSQIKYLLDTILITVRQQTRRFWISLIAWLHQISVFKKKTVSTEIEDDIEMVSKRQPKKSRIPKPIRIFNLIHAIDSENNPTIFLQYVQQLGHEFLQLPPFAPLPQITEALVIAYPHLDATRVRQLFQMLETALYSGTYTFSPDIWKAEFKDLFRTLPFRSAQLPAQTQEKQGLPSLNPKCFEC